MFMNAQSLPRGPSLMVLGRREGGGRGKDEWREQGVVMFRGGWEGDEEVKVSWGGGVPRRVW